MTDAGGRCLSARQQHLLRISKSDDPQHAAISQALSIAETDCLARVMERDFELLPLLTISVRDFRRFGGLRILHPSELPPERRNKDIRIEDDANHEPGYSRDSWRPLRAAEISASICSAESWSRPTSLEVSHDF